MVVVVVVVGVFVIGIVLIHPFRLFALLLRVVCGWIVGVRCAVLGWGCCGVDCVAGVGRCSRFVLSVCVVVVA